MGSKPQSLNCWFLNVVELRGAVPRGSRVSLPMALLNVSDHMTKLSGTCVRRVVAGLWWVAVCHVGSRIQTRTSLATRPVWTTH